MAEKTKEDVEKYVKQVAEKRGWVLNLEDQETHNFLVEGLQNYFNNVGYFNCPCRDCKGDIKQDRDIVCPCDYAQPDIDEYGHCYCGLYYRKEYDFSKPLEMIPERRPEDKW